ncbi:MAG: 4Fe-4S dicluster domain-containing protein, partial [bacterium]|nr:4Fe-4S dicluster domain-containing protein [bacterium]
LTDMPLATDKPISFGLKEFCRVCGRCAESCPSKAISTKTDPDFVPLGPYSNPGHEAWFEDSVKCYEYWYQSGSYCSVCYMVCPWAKQDKTAIHEIVKASSTKIPALDRLFISMDQRFGYGQQKDPDAWWDLDLNEFGIDRILR